MPGTHVSQATSESLPEKRFALPASHSVHALAFEPLQEPCEHATQVESAAPLKVPPTHTAHADSPTPE